MTNIHLVGGEKGGVGKSLISRLLAQTRSVVVEERYEALSHVNP